MRNLIGYSNRLPHSPWQGDARIAINFVINYEEGAESNILDGDNNSESFLAEIAGLTPAVNRRTYFTWQRPGRAEAIYKFIEYVNEHQNIWICCRCDIAIQ